MAYVRRVGSAQWLGVVAGFVASAVAVALLSASGSSLVARDSEPLSAPAPGFNIPTPVPLNDASTVTRWAPVIHRSVARSAPSNAASPVGEVSTLTPEGTTNLLVADGEAEQSGQAWVHVRLAALPNGTEGWLPRSALGGWSFVDTRLIVDRTRLTATLFRAGRVIFRSRVAVGAPATPTPSGVFYVRDRLAGFVSPMYGVLAFGTSARSPTLTDWPNGGFVGIHGTDRPALIPGRVSHGCIRLTNRSILTLGKLMPIGTPLIVK
jgi:lipoprotein-anchoring transpeptidase ErfK/SrfK